MGCQPEPDISCNGIRFTWALPDISFSSSDDADENMPGIQTNLEVRVELPPETAVTLLVEQLDASDGDTLSTEEYSAAVSAEGEVKETITLPEGRVRITVVGNTSCREVRSSRTVFVFDEGGDVSCEVLAADAMPDENGVWFFNSDADVDLSTDELEIALSVVTGRPDVLVSLLVLDSSNGKTEENTQTSGESSDADFTVPISEAGTSVRATCSWTDQEIVRFSTTRVLKSVEAPH